MTTTGVICFILGFFLCMAGGSAAAHLFAGGASLIHYWPVALLCGAGYALITHGLDTTK